MRYMYLKTSTLCLLVFKTDMAVELATYMMHANAMFTVLELVLYRF